MSARIQAWAAMASGQPLVPYTFEPGELGAEEVEIAVEHCGLCHSDLSMLDNEWRASTYPLVAGHEVIGRVVGLGSAAKGLQLGQRVGLGWNAGSCLHCSPCLSGLQQMCDAVQPTIIGHHGGFAERVRAHSPRLSSASSIATKFGRRMPSVVAISVWLRPGLLSSRISTENCAGVRLTGATQRRKSSNTRSCARFSA